MTIKPDAVVLDKILDAFKEMKIIDELLFNDDNVLLRSKLLDPSLSWYLESKSDYIIIDIQDMMLKAYEELTGYSVEWGELKIYVDTEKLILLFNELYTNEVI